MDQSIGHLPSLEADALGPWNHCCLNAVVEMLLSYCERLVIKQGKASAKCGLIGHSVSATRAPLLLVETDGEGIECCADYGEPPDQNRDIDNARVANESLGSLVETKRNMSVLDPQGPIAASERTILVNSIAKGVAELGICCVVAAITNAVRLRCTSLSSQP